MFRPAVLLLVPALLAALDFGAGAGFSPLSYDATSATLPPWVDSDVPGTQPFEVAARAEQPIGRLLRLRFQAGYEGRIAYLDRSETDFRQSRLHGVRAGIGLVCEVPLLRRLAARAGLGATYSWHRLDRDLVAGFRYRSEGTLDALMQTFIVGLRWLASDRVSVLVEAEPAGVSWVVERGRVFSWYELQTGRYEMSVLVPDLVRTTGISLGVMFGP